MDKLKTLYESVETSMNLIKEKIEEIEEKNKIKYKTYQSIRVASKEIRDASQIFRKEILKKFKEQKEKK